MFLLYKSASPTKGTEYNMFAGKKSSISLKRAREMSQGQTDQEPILEIESDLEYVTHLKGNAELKLKLSRLNEVDLTSFKKSVLLEFLMGVSCEASRLKVCNKCGLMFNAESNRAIGSISMRASEVQNMLDSVQNWACDDCRIELAVITWQTETTHELEIVNDKRKVINGKIRELLKEKYLEVQKFVNVSPAIDDYKVVSSIRSNLESVLSQMKSELPKGINKPYKALVVKSFLAYHRSPGGIRAIRICDRCGHFWKYDEDLGHLSVDVHEMGQLHQNIAGWICKICRKIPSLSIYALEKNNKTNEYYIKLSGDNKMKITKTTDYVNIYVCLELFDQDFKLLEDFLIQLKEKKVIRNKGDIFVSDSNKQDLMKLILNEFLTKKTKNLKKYNVCKYCCHIFNGRGKELGSFWASEELLPSAYSCPAHVIRCLLFWNMTGWKTLEKVMDEQKPLLDDTDVICLTETHIVDRNHVDVEDDLPGHVAVIVEAEKRAAQGRGSGGLMFLIKNKVMCQQTRLEFSNRGVFTKLQVLGNTFIVGGIYWRPEPGENESIEDWITELDNFLSVNKRDGVHFVIGGDFNGRIKEDDCYRPVGLFKGTALSETRNSADSKGNKRGRLLLAVMSKHELVLCNGRTKSDKLGAFTCKTVNGDSVVDYIWVSAGLVPGVADMAVVDVYSGSADFHRGLLLKLNNAT